MFIRAVRRSGRWFPEKGCIWEHQIFSFAEMILRDRRSTSYDLASLFRGRRNSLDRREVEKSQNALVRGQQLCAQFSIFEGRLAELLCFWCCPTSKIEEVSQNCFVFWCCQVQKLQEVSQNCFVFDVVKFKNWGSLAELLRFQAYS